MKRTLSLLAFITMLALLTVPAPGEAQAPSRRRAAATPQPDAYEPDEAALPWLGQDEAQNRSFYPGGDVDRARFRVKAGRWYEVHTSGLGPLVDTVLTVEVSGRLYKDDDGGSEELSSRIIFQATETADAIVTVTNAQEVYGIEQTYKLLADETTPPTPAPTSTLRPTREAPATATPAKPIVNFAAVPERVARPGDCLTLRWAVDRASEVFLVLPNGNREGVEGAGQRQVCPVESSTYTLKVNAPGGDETAEVRVVVPLPSPTPTDAGLSRSTGSDTVSERGTAPLHVAVFVDENGSEVYDPVEGVAGVTVMLMAGTDPGQVEVQRTDALGQTHFAGTEAGVYTVLLPYLGYAASLTLRGEEQTLHVLFPALRLPSRIP